MSQFHYTKKNMEIPILETQRLILKKFTKSDLSTFYTIFKDVEVHTYLPWYPLASLEEAAVFYEERYENASGYHYAVCDKHDQIPIGYINVSMEDHHDLGYGLKKEYWHKGIMSEACAAVIQQVKQDGLPYVTATHDIKNKHSGNVMKKIGMQYKYTYEEQWQPKDITVLFRMYQLDFNHELNRTYKKYWNTSSVRFVELL